MELKKLVLEVGKKTIELTPTEARELKAILTDLFGGEKTVFVPQVIKEIVDRRPYWYDKWTLTAPNAGDIVYCSNTCDQYKATL